MTSVCSWKIFEDAIRCWIFIGNKSSIIYSLNFLIHFFFFVYFTMCNDCCSIDAAEPGDRSNHGIMAHLRRHRECHRHIQFPMKQCLLGSSVLVHLERDTLMVNHHHLCMCRVLVRRPHKWNSNANWSICPNVCCAIFVDRNRVLRLAIRHVSKSPDIFPLDRNDLYPSRTQSSDCHRKLYPLVASRQCSRFRLFARVRQGTAMRYRWIVRPYSIQGEQQFHVQYSLDAGISRRLSTQNIQKKKKRECIQTQLSTKSFVSEVSHLCVPVTNTNFQRLCILASYTMSSCRDDIWLNQGSTARININDLVIVSTFYVQHSCHPWEF